MLQVGTMVSSKDLAACVSANANQLYTKFRVQPNRATDVDKPPVGEKSPLFFPTPWMQRAFYNRMSSLWTKKIRITSEKLYPYPVQRNSTFGKGTFLLSLATNPWKSNKTLWCFPRGSGSKKVRSRPLPSELLVAWEICLKMEHESTRRRER